MYLNWVLWLVKEKKPEKQGSIGTMNKQKRKQQGNRDTSRKINKKWLSWIKKTDSCHLRTLPSNHVSFLCMYACSVASGCLTLVTLWTVAHQASLSMGFFRQEYWIGLPCPPPRDLPNPGTESVSPALQADFFFFFCH